MDAQLKAKWIEALRGDKYEQERFEIGKGNKLCCIGVGGDVAGLRDKKAPWFTEEIATAIGLTVEERVALIRLNDRQKKGFFEIADYIEANL